LNITILNDTDDKLGDNAEARVGATPDIVKNYVASGHKVTVVKGAGKYANHYDADYKSAGAIISSSNKVACKDADLVLSITGKDAKFVAD
jgi:NAD(P) transhydrogenase subunit alpha